MASNFIKIVWVVCFTIIISESLNAQVFYFQPTVIPIGGQTCIPVNVLGVPYSLDNPIFPANPPSSYIWPLCFDIQTTHPWTMEITLISPMGTVLILSSFNGVGGVNYTNTCFEYGMPPIAGSAPFTGTWGPQQSPPGLDIFNGENPNGIWQLCITDTLTDSTSFTPGPPGIGATSVGSGTIGFGSTCGPCQLQNGTANASVCPGEYIDLSLFIPIAPCPPIAQFYFNGSPCNSFVNIPGTYTIYLQDPIDMFCTATITVTLTNAIPPNLGPDQTVDICGGYSTDLHSYFNMIGVTNPIWSYNGSFIPSSVASAATQPGVYELIAEDAIGCKDTALITLNIIPAPDLGPDITVGNCPTAPFDLTTLFTTTGLTINWTLNGNPVANPGAVSTSGTYMLVAENATGCLDTALAILSFATAPNLGADQTVDLCSNDPVNLQTLFTTTGFITSWTLGGNAVSNPASVNTAGVYTLIASNSNGCADTALATLNVFSAPALGADQSINGCTSGPYNLTPLYNTAGLTANWFYNGNPVSNPAAVTQNGNFTLIVENPSGCTDTAVVNLFLVVNPSLGADQNISVCNGASVDLTALYNTTGYTTTWTTGGSPVSNPASVTAAGTYTLIATIGPGCADTANVVLAVVSPPSLGANQQADLCSNNSFDLTVVYNTTGYTTSWTLNGNNVANPSAVTQAGNYILIASAGGGCSDTAIIALNISPAPNLGADQGAGICPGDVFDLNSLYTITGLTVSWTLSGVNVSNPSAINTPGNYLLVATDPVNGCFDSAFVNVTNAQVPVIGPDQQVTGCTGYGVDLTSVYSTTGYTVNWTSNGNPVPDPANISTAGNYTITCTNSAGCTATAMVTVGFNASPSVGSDQNVTICTGDYTNLSALFNLTGYAYNWSLNGSPVPDPVNVNTAGNYVVIASGGNGCNDTAYAQLTVNANPDPGASQTFDLCPWNNVDLTSLFNTQGLNVNWTLNGQSVQQLTSVHDPGVYVLTVTDNAGCSGTTSASINEIPCECNADFIYSGTCIQEPFAFEVLADSMIVSIEWSFNYPGIQSQYGTDASVKFPTDGVFVVTMNVELTCGNKAVQKNIQAEDCAKSCPVYIPNAFSPNQDGKNDVFHTYTDCDPLEFEIEIRNRFGQVVFKSGNQKSGWDASDAPVGLYVYNLIYKMPYQAEKTSTGRVSLVR